MAGRLFFVWVLIGALLGVGAASSAVLVDAAPIEVAAAETAGAASAVAAPAVGTPAAPLLGDRVVLGVEDPSVYCAEFPERYPAACSKPPVDPPSPSASITNVTQSCEAGAALVRIEGGSNVDRLLVLLTLGNAGIGTGVDVVNGTYSAVLDATSEALPATFTITVSDDITDFATTTVLVQSCDAPAEPIVPAGTIVFNDDGVTLSCEMGNYLVSVSGTANVPEVTVEAFDGGEPGRATFTVTNGRYSGELVVPADPDADGGTMKAIVHTPETPDPPGFMALGEDTFTYTPCPPAP